MTSLRCLLTVRLITVPMCNSGHTAKAHRPRPAVRLTFSRKALRILLGYADQPSVQTNRAHIFWQHRRTCCNNPSARALSRVWLTTPGPPQACRHHHGEPHPDNASSGFDPNFVRLHVQQIQLSLLDDRLMHPFTLLSRSIAPTRDGSFI